MKAQTATEYLIILAVVIVIALIVVGVMGGIPSIGGGASESAARAQLRVMDVGIQNYMINSKYTLLKVSNNQASAITITDMTVNGKGCSFRDTRLRAGETKDIGCYGVKSNDDGTKFQYPITITYTDSATNAEYVINDSNVPLVGTIAGGSELHTGQQTCWVGNSVTQQDCSASSAKGQDGNVDGTAKSFSVLSDNVMKDEHTGLYWTTNESGAVNRSVAISTCNDLVQGGFSDWRLPNMLELTTVLDFGTLSNSSPNQAWVNGPYWSSTATTVFGSTYYLQPVPQEGYMYVDVRTNAEQPGVRSVCVRGETSAIQLKDTSKNFEDLLDGTIADKDTGLIWQKDNTTSELNWNDSISYCDNLVLCANNTWDGNSTTVGSCSGDSIRHDDWRLPTIYEAVTLNEYDTVHPTSVYPEAFGHDYSYIWTSSTLAAFPDFAYIGDLSTGEIDSGDKADSLYDPGRVLCVKG